MGYAESSLPATDTASGPRRDIAELGDLAIEPSVERAVAAVRDFLGMDVAYATENVDGQQVFRAIHGDAESFGMYVGLEVPLSETFCQKVLEGRLPNLMPDVRNDPRSQSMPAAEAADIGAFVTVPIVLSDGRLHGTLCAASHSTEESLEYRDLQFLHVFARIVADQIEHAEQREHSHALEPQAGATSTLLAAIEARDGHNGELSQAVLELAVEVARRLGLAERELDQVGQEALLDDIARALLEVLDER